MATTLSRIIGRNLTVTVAGVKTIWTDLSLSFSADEDNATAADSVLRESVFTTASLEGTLSGYQGSVNHGGTLPALGDAISDLAVAEGANSLIPSLASYTNIKVSKVDYRWQQGPATWEFSFGSGKLNTLGI